MFYMSESQKEYELEYLEKGERMKLNSHSI